MREILKVTILRDKLGRIMKGSPTPMPPTKTYGGLHQKMRRLYGKADYCLFDKEHKTKTGKFEWANITGSFEPNLNNYIPLCISCHRKLDTTEKTRELISISKRGNQNRKRAVLQFSLTGELLGSYKSMKEAREKSNTRESSICLNLSGKYKTAGGFVWKYSAPKKKLNLRLSELKVY